MKKFILGLTGGLTLASTVASTVLASDVVIGVPNWPSVRITANVIKVALEDNFGLEVELQNATNPIVFEGMDTGSMHIHPEVWLPNQQGLHDKFVKERKSVIMTPAGVPAEQGLCVTAGTASRTGVKSILELSDPDMAKNFDTDGDGQGEVWIGAPGWASTNVEKIRAKSYGYDQTFQLKEMDESLALAEVDVAVEQNKDIVFFCYSPHHMFKLHDLVQLEEPAYDASKWNVKQPTDGADWLEVSSAPVAWPTAYLHIHYSAELASKYPDAAKMLAQVTFSSKDISDMTYALVVDKRDPGDFAKEWLSANTSSVDDWLK